MTERLSAVVGARISEFKRKMAEVKAIAKTVPNTITVKVKARTDAAQKSLDSLADTLRTFETVSQSMASGALLAMSPAAVPLLATAVAAMASLGPMIGVAAGGMAGLATAFGVAGAGAAAVTGIMVSNLNEVFAVSKDVKDLQDKLAVTKDAEKRAEILKEIATIQGTLNKHQSTAYQQLQGLQSAWGKLSNKLEKPSVEIFGKAMRGLTNLLGLAEPVFINATGAVNKLMDAFNAQLNTESFRKFFDWMGKAVGPAIETLGMAGMNFMTGFMNLMRAFGPLSVTMQEGLLGMSQRFADWTKGLEKSDKFKSFIDYVKENGPKLLDIFGNITGGLVGMFSAFAPMSADMMTGLQNLTQRFEEWGQKLSENKSFQEFASYVRENTPKVLSLIGNLTDFILNLAVGMAPLGSKILDLVNGFLQWSNGMMEAHPWLKKVAGAVLVGVGVFKMIVPPILAAKAMFKGFGGLLAKLFPSLKTIFATFKTNLIIGLKMLGQRALMFGKTIGIAALNVMKWFGKMALRAVSWALRMAAQWIVAMGPVGWVIATVIGLAVLIIANWDKIKNWTKKAWSAVSKFVSETWSKIWNWTKEKASAIANTVRDKFQQAKQNVQDKMTATLNTIKSKWASIKSTVTSKVGSILNTIRSKFQEAVNAVREKMNAAKEKVTSIWESIQEFFDGIDLYESGKAIIQSAIDGLAAMKSKITSKVEEIAGAVRAFWPFSPAKEGPLSDIHRMDFSGPINKSIQRAKNPVRAAMNDLAMTAKPQVAFDGAFNANQHFNAEDYETKEEIVIVEMDGREVGRGVKGYVSEFQERDKRREVRFR